jgi:hypothetical protein
LEEEEEEEEEDEEEEWRRENCAREFPQQVYAYFGIKFYSIQTLARSSGTRVKTRFKSIHTCLLVLDTP